MNNAAQTVKGREMQTRESYMESLRAIRGVLSEALGALDDAEQLAAVGQSHSTQALALAGRKARHAAAGVVLVLEERMDLAPVAR